MEVLVANTRPRTLLTAGVLLASACNARAHASVNNHCDSCCALNDVSWLLGWITYARRASFVLMMLSGIVLYCMPESRAPAKKGCFFMIDAIANGLKAIIGKIVVSKDIEFNKEADRYLMPKSFMDENALISNFEEVAKQYSFLKKQEQPSVSFNIPDSDPLRERRRRLRCLEHKNENEKLRYRQLHCEIHQPCAMKFKEKTSVEKVTDRPLPLMQFDTFKRQNLNASFTMTNDNCDPDLRRCYEKAITDSQRKRKKCCLSDSCSRNGTEKDYKQFRNFFKLDERSLNKDASEIEISQWTDSEYDKKILEFKNNDKSSQNYTHSNTKNTSFSNKQIYEVDELRHKTCPVLIFSKKSNETNDTEKHEFFKSIERSVSTDITEQIQPVNPKRYCKSCSNREHVKETLKDSNEDEEDISYNDEKLHKHSNKSSISRIFNWIFGGCPTAKYSKSFSEKRISTMVQAKLSEYF